MFQALKYLVGLAAGAAFLLAIASHAKACDVVQTQFVGAFNTASFVNPFAFQQQVFVQRQFVPIQRQVIVQRNFVQRQVVVQRQRFVQPVVVQQVVVPRFQLNTRRLSITRF